MDREQNPELKPGVDVHKRTTKVNIGVVLGVMAFLIVTFVAVIWYQRHPSRTVEEQHDRVESRP